ncbi:MAG: SDR family NAD(P)-dependent oxidoreductase [Candidatus Methylomirabilales bacterium]
MRLTGKVALVTGGSRGIGLAVAQAFGREGARVVVVGRDETALGEAVRTPGLTGTSALAIPADISDPAAVAALAVRVQREVGALHVLVNNASILGPRVPVAAYPIEAWQEVLAVNLTGVFLVIRALLPLMERSGGGSIINVSSGVGRTGKGRWGAYAVSKFGLEGLTQVLADECQGTGIRVNAVNPGGTRTAMRATAYPQEDPNTLLRPEEITPVFVYLASDESRTVTGQSLDARDYMGRSALSH